MPRLMTALLLLLFVFAIFAAESTDHSSSSSSKKHEHFMPLVAFQCGYRNKFMNAEGRWQDDPSSVASCLHGKYDILKYCKRVYPGEKVTNIVEYSHLTRIVHWCREDGTDCRHQFTVRPFRCIAGEFETESLQVPNRCHFSHILGRDKCNDYKFWNAKSEQECTKKKDTKGHPMRLRSFAILEPCGLSMFRGVEFVCCPRDLEERIEKVVDLEAEATAAKLKSSKDDEEEEEEEEDDEEYDDDEEEEQQQDDKIAKKESTADAKAEQDPYFKDDPQANEHERFREAEERLEKRHRKKVTKVITEWSELFERYSKMKEKDPKGAEQYKRNMTAKFRKTVAALEAENKEQRKQIEELHDERVQTVLNEKKRQATHEYRAALAVQVGQANRQNVLRTLKNYIRAEEKDRQHMLNRYRHLLRSDPEAALSFEPVLLHRLRYIDLRINGTLAMLRDFPSLEKEIRPLALAFWKSYRRENTPEILEELSAKKEGGRYLSEEERNERLIRLYKQNFERHHPGSRLTIKLQELTPKSKAKVGTTVVAAVPTTTHKSMVVPLKEVLKESKAADEAEEDSDEDQFEEDEESAEKANPTPTTTTAAPKRIHVELLNKAEEKKAKTTEQEGEKPAKVMSNKMSSSSSSDSEESAEEEEEADEDEDNEQPTDAKKKHLRVDIEPIVLAPAPGEIDEELLSTAFEKHHRQRIDSRPGEDDGSTMFGQWLAQTNLLLGLVAMTLAVLTVVVLLRRRRNRHPGFIEVDVCTPEERHVAGMQVNGYENPTYSFFEGKHAC